MAAAVQLSDKVYINKVYINTDYISEEEERKVEGMLAFLTEESKQAAASTATDMYTTPETHHHQGNRLTSTAVSHYTTPEALHRYGNKLTSTAVSYYGTLHLKHSITMAAD
ncbi:unnamed protein product [Boreogadus saida]